MVDDMYNPLTKKLALLKRTHMKVMLPEKMAYITNQYEQLLLEFDGEVETTIKGTADGIEISMKIGSTVTCDDGGHSLNILIGIANASRFDVIHNKIVFELWFRCWEWIGRS